MTMQLHITFILTLLTILSSTGIGQTIKNCEPVICDLNFDSTINRSYYLNADTMPTYRGGTDSLMQTIKNYLKWPCGECSLNGRVYVAFIIELDGKLTNKRIIKSFMDNDTNICNINKEALNVVDYLTDWTAGKCNGKNVAVQVVLPIQFKLN